MTTATASTDTVPRAVTGRRKPVFSFQTFQGESFETWRDRHFKQAALSNEWVDGEGKTYTEERLKNVHWFRQQNFSNRGNGRS